MIFTAPPPPSAVILACFLYIIQQNCHDAISTCFFFMCSVPYGTSLSYCKKYYPSPHSRGYWKLCICFYFLPIRGTFVHLGTIR
jgi:hypothetical protein